MHGHASLRRLPVHVKPASNHARSAHGQRALLPPYLHLSSQALHRLTCLSHPRHRNVSPAFPLQAPHCLVQQGHLVAWCAGRWPVACWIGFSLGELGCVAECQPVQAGVKVPSLRVHRVLCMPIHMLPLSCFMNCTLRSACRVAL